MVKAYVRGFAEGWNKARASISNCEAGERIVDVEMMNAREWQ
jgi:hypothetical protein